jgi:hypothetical protein
MYVSRLRGVAAAAARELPRHTQQLTKRSATVAFSTTARQNQSQNQSQSQEPPAPPPAATTSTTAHTQTAPQVTDGPAPTAVAQAPNRAEVWSRSQQPRAAAMSGPRFEQTDFELQVCFFFGSFFLFMVMMTRRLFWEGVLAVVVGGGVRGWENWDRDWDWDWEGPVAWDEAAS